MSPNRTVSAGSAFTLVELLVVIGIIGVLMSLLLPAMSRAREIAKTTQCAAQLRNIGQAVAMYVDANAGWSPNWSGWHVAGGDGTGEDEAGPGWTEKLTRYLGVGPTSPVYHCPAFPDDCLINYFISGRWSFANDRHSFRYSEIRLTSQFILSGDCTEQLHYPPAYGTNPTHHLDDCDKDDASKEAVLFAGADGGINMHRSGNNVLFADFHVELCHSFDPHSMTYHPSEMRAWSDVSP